MTYEFARFHESVVTITSKVISMELDGVSFSTCGSYMNFIIIVRALKIKRIF
jgi:hypothetical protein